NALKFHRLLLDVGMRNFPPPSFFEGEVNIDASSITAREAILEIMRQAPMPIPVRYYHLGSSYNISLGFVIDGEIYFKDRPEDLLVPREQQVWFNQEMQDVRTCGQWEQESSDDSSAGNPDSESPVLSPSGPDTRLVPAVYEVLDADCFLWQIPNVLVDANDVQSASKKVTGLSDGSMMLELIDGIPSIHPVEDRVNDMDVLVTLQLKNVSLWEAIKAALQQMNCNKEFGYEMEPPLVMNHLYKRIPTLFFEKCMDLSVTNRPAREAFCAIAAAAPVQVGMRYSQRGSFPYRPSFGITLYEDGKPMRFTGRRWQSREEALWWENEKHEATLPAEECLPEPGEQAAGQ
nr:hypothetical protein [Synergistaceae bacterium]